MNTTMREPCFACGKGTSKPQLADTRDGQIVRVGRECHVLIREAGAAGYQPPRGGPRLWLIDGPTDGRARFVFALTLLCGGNRPDEAAVDAWLANRPDEPGDSYSLQAWAVDHSGLYWAQGIALLEAAQHLSFHPVEGFDHAE